MTFHPGRSLELEAIAMVIIIMPHDEPMFRPYSTGNSIRTQQIDSPWIKGPSIIQTVPWRERENPTWTDEQRLKLTADASQVHKTTNQRAGKVLKYLPQLDEDVRGYGRPTKVCWIRSRSVVRREDENIRQKKKKKRKETNKNRVRRCKTLEDSINSGLDFLTAVCRVQVVNTHMLY